MHKEAGKTSARSARWFATPALAPPARPAPNNATACSHRAAARPADGRMWARHARSFATLLLARVRGPASRARGSAAACSLSSVIPTEHGRAKDLRVPISVPAQLRPALDPVLPAANSAVGTSLRPAMLPVHGRTWGRLVAAVALAQCQRGCASRRPAPRAATATCASQERRVSRTEAAVAGVTPLRTLLAAIASIVTAAALANVERKARGTYLPIQDLTARLRDGPWKVPLPTHPSTWTAVLARVQCSSGARRPCRAMPRSV